MERGRHGRQRLAVKCDFSSLCYKSQYPVITPEARKGAEPGASRDLEATGSIAFSPVPSSAIGNFSLVASPRPSKLRHHLQSRPRWRVRHRRGGSRGGDGSLFPRFGADGNSRPFTLFFSPHTPGTALPIVRTLIARGVLSEFGSRNPRGTEAESDKG